MSARIYSSGAVRGPYFMKFTLIYDGELKANSPKQKKWDIRKTLAPQLEQLWRVSGTLADLKASRYATTGLGYVFEMHHDNPYPRVPEDFLKEGKPPSGWIDLLSEVTVGDRKFLPLIRNSLGLKCGLKIIFLRQEEPGKLYQGGDIDNRLKTLFDSLSVPKPEQLIDDPTAPDPLHCLLEDDGLISGVSVETHRLLERPNGSIHEVKLIIEVDVRIAKARNYNQPLWGE